MKGLYIVQLQGEPATDHPAYWMSGKTALTIALFAQDEREAEERAKQLACMMYIDVSDCSVPQRVAEPHDATQFPVWGKNVLRDGIAFSVNHLATGAE